MAAATVAAQRLMQLSDEYHNNINNNYDDHKYHDDPRVKIDNIGITERTIWAKIEEIFGKELEEVCGDAHDHRDHRRRKKRKYRSLDSIYSRTQPIGEMKRMILKRKS
ncbi:hypothetical protein TIFTF001_004110 [Ficus carica]|uniref:Uncharacterized protein n=1 Tax=Ficus carica TaxID=3494 RepID=A0AA87ZHI9_FICCA|nr:hypothetical protein TIFTF001_004110 [Ficus carica]